MYSATYEYEDISSFGENIFSDTQKLVNHKIKSRRGICAVCGAKPTGINFDVLTCSSCKAFFRRNGNKPLDQFICRISGECKIDERTRRQCTACRIKKCFAMGMIKERIRTEEQNLRHRALVEENRRQKLLKCQQYQQQDEESQPNMMEFDCHKAIHKVSSCLYLNNSSNHIDLLSELFFESVQQTIPEDFTLQCNYNLTDMINLYCTPITCFIAFLKQVPQFQQLPVDDRLILLKYNIKILLPILMHTLNLSCGLPIHIKHPGVYNINNKIGYAYSLFAKMIPDDNKLLTILLVMFLFCPCLLANDLLCDAGSITNLSRKLIQDAYDLYAQYLWQYIVKNCQDNQEQAILKYTKLVTKFLHLQNVTNDIYDIVECSVEINKLHMMMQSILHLT